MRQSVRLLVKVGARGSRLSQKQVQEVIEELKIFHSHAEFECIWVKTAGDYDKVTSLRWLDKTDFFTREIEELQLAGLFRVSVHSAKDLPTKLRAGLEVAAITKGVSNADALVYRHWPLPLQARIGTSSLRREQALGLWRSDLRCVDVRGTIDERLQMLQDGDLDGLVIAEAALIRLGLQALPRIVLSGETAPLQGKLAIVVHSQDEEMKRLFLCLNAEESYS